MKGLGVSPGIVMGQVYVDWKEQLEIEKDYVDDAEGEVAVSYTHLTLPTICSV